MHELLAGELIQAEMTRTPIAPLSQRWPGLDRQGAYAIQAIITEWRLAEGRRPVGKKVGYTNLEAQRAKGLDEPMWAEAFAADLAPDGTLPVGRLIAPRVEPEIAFLLGRDLHGPGVDEAAVLQATAELLPALEVVDSHYVDGRFNGLEGIADSGVHACLVLGTTGVSPAGLDLAALEGRLERNGQLIARGAGAAVLGHPARAVAWLANALGASGRWLRAGEVISSGTLAGAHSIVPGDHLRVTIEAVGGLEVQTSH